MGKMNGVKFVVNNIAASIVISAIIVVAIAIAAAVPLLIYGNMFAEKVPDKPESASFTADVLSSNLKITYTSGPSDLSKDDVVILYALKDGSTASTNQATLDFDKDGKWDTGDYFTVNKDTLSDPCAVTVVVRGTTVLDTTVDL